MVRFYSVNIPALLTPKMQAEYVEPPPPPAAPEPAPVPDSQGDNLSSDTAQGGNGSNGSADPSSDPAT